METDEIYRRWWCSRPFLSFLFFLSFFFFFFNPAAVYRGRWWLSDIGSSRGADEEFSPSSLTQGYGSILLSTLFLLHHETPSFCLSPLHLQSYRQLSLLSFLAACWGSRPHFFSPSISVCPSPFPALSLCVLPLSPTPGSGPAHIEASIIRIGLSRGCFLTFTQSSP